MCVNPLSVSIVELRRFLVISVFIGKNGCVKIPPLPEGFIPFRFSFWEIV
jgi:hypothetical protein